MNLKRWKMGLLVATLQAAVIAGSTLVAPGSNWKTFVAAFCTALGPLWANWVKQHPIEDIQDTQFIKKEQNENKNTNTTTGS